MADVIPDDIKKFIFENIDTIAELEGILLFHTNPETKWNAKSVSQRLYVGEPEARGLLVKLAMRGFLTEDEDSFYQYQPKPTELQDMIERMGQVYAQYLVPVTHLVHSKPKLRIQEFADAFRIRKDQ